MPVLESLALAVDARQVAQATRHLREFERAAVSSAEDMQRWERSATGLASTGAGLARTLRNVVGAIAIEETVRRSVSAFADYEQQMAEIAKTTDLTDEELSALGTRFNDLAIELRGQVTSAELREIAAEAGRLGIQGSANIAAFTEAVGKLTVATPLAAGEAAQAFGRLLALTGESPKNVEALGSAFAAVADQVSAGEREILPTIENIARGTAQFGASAQDIIGLSAALAGLGIPGEAARTTFLKLFQDISLAAAGSQEELTKLAAVASTTTAQFQQLAQQNVTQAFVTLLESVRALGTVERRSAIADLIGADARGLATIGTMVERVDELRGVLATTSREFARPTRLTEELARQMARTTSGIDLFAEAVRQAIGDLGSGLGPALSRVAVALARGLDTGAIRQFGQLVGSVVDVAAAALENFVDFLQSDVARGIGSALGSAVEFLTRHMNLLVVAVGALAASRLNRVLATWGQVFAGVGQYAVTAGRAMRAFAAEGRVVSDLMLVQQRATVERAAAQVAAARASQVAAGSMAGLAAATNTATVAEVRLARETGILAAMQLRLGAGATVAARGMSLIAAATTAAWRGFTRLVGPAGVILLAVEALSLFMLTTRDVEDEVDGLERATTKYLETVNRIRAGTLELAQNPVDIGTGLFQRTADQIAIIEGRLAELRSAQRDYSLPLVGDVLAWLDQLTGSGLAVEIDRLAERLDVLRGRLEDIREARGTDITQQAQELYPAPGPQVRQRMSIFFNELAQQITRFGERSEVEAERVGRALERAFADTMTPLEALTAEAADLASVLTAGTAGLELDSAPLERAVDTAARGIAAMRAELLRAGEDVVEVDEAIMNLGVTSEHLDRIRFDSYRQALEQLQDEYDGVATAQSRALFLAEALSQQGAGGAPILEGGQVVAAVTAALRDVREAGGSIDRLRATAELFGAAGARAFQNVAREILGMTDASEDAAGRIGNLFQRTRTPIERMTADVDDLVATMRALSQEEIQALFDAAGVQRDVDLVERGLIQLGEQALNNEVALEDIERIFERIGDVGRAAFDKLRTERAVVAIDELREKYGGLEEVLRDARGFVELQAQAEAAGRGLEGEALTAAMADIIARAGDTESAFYSIIGVLAQLKGDDAMASLAQATADALAKVNLVKREAAASSGTLESTAASPTEAAGRDFAAGVEEAEVRSKAAAEEIGRALERAFSSARTPLQDLTLDAERFVATLSSTEGLGEVLDPRVFASAKDTALAGLAQVRAGFVALGLTAEQADSKLAELGVTAEQIGEITLAAQRLEWQELGRDVETVTSIMERARRQAEGLSAVQAADGPIDAAVIQAAAEDILTALQSVDASYEDLRGAAALFGEAGEAAFARIGAAAAGASAGLNDFQNVIDRIFTETRTPAEKLLIDLEEIQRALSAARAAGAAGTASTGGVTIDADLEQRALVQVGAQALDAGVAVSSLREAFAALGPTGKAAFEQIETERAVAEVERFAAQVGSADQALRNAQGFILAQRRAADVGRALEGETLTRAMTAIIVEAVEMGAAFDDVVAVLATLGALGPDALERLHEATERSREELERYDDTFSRLALSSETFTNTFARGLARGEGALSSLKDALARFREELISRSLEEAVFGPILDTVFGAGRRSGPTPGAEGGKGLLGSAIGAVGGLFGGGGGVVEPATAVPGAAPGVDTTLEAFKTAAIRLRDVLTPRAGAAATGSTTVAGATVVGGGGAPRATIVGGAGRDIIGAGRGDVLGAVAVEGEGFLSDVGAMFAGLWGDLTDVFAGAWSVLGRMFEGFTSGMRGIFDFAIEGFGVVFEPLMSGMESLFNWFVTALTGLFAADTASRGAGTGVDLLSSAGSLFSAFGGGGAGTTSGGSLFGFDSLFGAREAPAGATATTLPTTTSTSPSTGFGLVSSGFGGGGAATTSTTALDTTALESTNTGFLSSLGSLWDDALGGLSDLFGVSSSGSVAGTGAGSSGGAGLLGGLAGILGGFFGGGATGSAVGGGGTQDTALAYGGAAVGAGIGAYFGGPAGAAAGGLIGGVASGVFSRLLSTNVWEGLGKAFVAPFQAVLGGLRAGGGLISRIFGGIFHGGGVVPHPLDVVSRSSIVVPQMPRYHEGGVVFPVAGGGWPEAARAAIAAPITAPALASSSVHRLVERYHEGGVVRQVAVPAAVAAALTVAMPAAAGYDAAVASGWSPDDSVAAAASINFAGSSPVPAAAATFFPTTSTISIPPWPRYHDGGVVRIDDERDDEALAAELGRVRQGIEDLGRFHFGGYVEPSAAADPRRMLQLRPDEVPIIAQAGEVVLTAAQAKAIASFIHAERFHEGGEVGTASTLTLPPLPSRRDREERGDVQLSVSVPVTVEVRGRADRGTTEDLRRAGDQIAADASRRAVTEMLRLIKRDPGVQRRVRG